MRPLRFASLDSPIGRLWLVSSVEGLREVRRGDHLDGLQGTPDPAALAGPLAQLAAYLDGSSRNLDLPLDVGDASPFDAAVWRAAQAIPYGTNASYGDLAAAVGSPRGARAVGGAMARCPLSPVVPCHRVIHADGSIRGWGADLWVKRWLLDLEGTVARR
jgi:methylated-DNA-[protein]-cysteine S-methyltransferase